MTDGRVVDRVALALSPLLPGADAGLLVRLANKAVDAMLPANARVTEQCGVRFAGRGYDDPRDVSLVGACALAERIAAVGADQHVHRTVLITPWVVQPPTGVHEVGRGPVRPPAAVVGPGEAAA